MYLVKWEYKTADFWEDTKTIVTNDAAEVFVFKEEADALYESLRKDPDNVVVELYECKLISSTK